MAMARNTSSKRSRRNNANNDRHPRGDTVTATPSYTQGLTFAELDEWVTTRRTWLAGFDDPEEWKRAVQEVDELAEWLEYKKNERTFIHVLADALTENEAPSRSTPSSTK